MSNAASLSLFDKVGFKKVSECDYFKQVTLELAVPEATTTGEAATGAAGASGESDSEDPAATGTADGQREWTANCPPMGVRGRACLYMLINEDL